ncbi:MAG: hypothetical protein GX132_02250 [Erysipelotrichia bacterium]|nr:hypothetical protein [Erysipelotrichia bacterium]
MKQTKYKHLLLISLMSFFLLSGCARDIRSHEYLTKRVKNDLSEIYSVSYCATISINEYVKHHYPNQKALRIHMKSSNALVYGVDDDNMENLVFVPSYRTSKIYKFTLDNDVKYFDIVSHIQNEFSTIEKEQIKATLIDDEIIKDIPIILGFPITVNDITTIYYTHQNEIHSHIVS